MTATDPISDKTVSEEAPVSPKTPVSPQTPVSPKTPVSPQIQGPAGVALTSLLPGDRGVLSGHDLQPDESELLRALGLARRAPFRLCKAGSPWILQVRGTRIGLDDDVARRLTVTRTP